MTQSVILAAKRTPIGRFLGGLSRVPSPQLGTMVIEAVLDEVPAAKGNVDECIMGCVLQAGLGQNPARQAGLVHAEDELLSDIAGEVEVDVGHFIIPSPVPSPTPMSV